MRVYGTNPVGELLMLTNPRRKKRLRRNLDVWNEWEKEWEATPKARSTSSDSDKEYDARIRREYELKYGKKKGAKKVAKKRKSSKRRSGYASLVKKHGITAAAKLWKKIKGGGGKKAKKSTKRRVKKSTARRGITLRAKGRRKKARVTISASRPMKITANPRKRRKYHRRRKTIMLNPQKRYTRRHTRRHYRRNPRHARSSANFRGMKFDAMSIAMMVVGFGAHRFLLKGTDNLVKKVPIAIVQQYSFDIANILIPLAGYILFTNKNTAKYVNRIPYIGKYKKQILSGTYVSAGMVFAKRVLPTSISQYIPFGAGNDGITLVPNMSGYVDGLGIAPRRSFVPMNGYMDGNSPDFLLGDGETADDLGLGSDEFLLG